MNSKIATAFFKSYGLPEPEYEYKHIPGRSFRLDVAWPKKRIGIESQGGIYGYRPSHTSARQILRDMEKDNLGLAHGWIVFKFQPAVVLMKECIDMLLMVWDLERKYEEPKAIAEPTPTE
jgi:hypothetical protein